MWFKVWLKVGSKVKLRLWWCQTVADKMPPEDSNWKTIEKQMKNTNKHWNNNI